jgi:Carboxypeptidase regulatory-like domain
MVLVAIAVSGCAARPVVKKEPTPVEKADSVIIATTETTNDASIPAGEVDGVVVHAYHGTPIPNVAIWAYSLTTKQRWQSQTDSVGRFQIVDLPSERLLFVFRLIGYRIVSDTIDMHRGVAARIALVENTLRLCTCLVPPDVPAVTVLVRDALTNRAPEVSVTFRLRDGSFTVDTVAPAPTSSDSVLELNLKPCREGTYWVEVSAPGYKTWRARDVKAAAINCVNFVPRRIPVWLLPTSRSVRSRSSR